MTTTYEDYQITYCDVPDWGETQPSPPERHGFLEAVQEALSQAYPGADIRTETGDGYTSSVQVTHSSGHVYDSGPEVDRAWPPVTKQTPSIDLRDVDHVIAETFNAGAFWGQWCASDLRESYSETQADHPLLPILAWAQKYDDEKLDAALAELARARYHDLDGLPDAEQAVCEAWNALHNYPREYRVTLCGTGGDTYRVVLGVDHTRVFSPHGRDSGDSVPFRHGTAVERLQYALSVALSGDYAGTGVVYADHDAARAAGHDEDSEIIVWCDVDYEVVS